LYFCTSKASKLEYLLKEIADRRGVAGAPSVYAVDVVQRLWCCGGLVSALVTAAERR
jgi:hypothetical protein